MHIGSNGKDEDTIALRLGDINQYYCETMMLSVMITNIKENCQYCNTITVIIIINIIKIVKHML